VLTFATLGQASVVVGALGVASLLAPRIRGLIDRAGGPTWVGKGLSALKPLALPLVWLLLVGIAYEIAFAQESPRRLLEITFSLLAAWVVINLFARAVRNPVWARVVASTAWTVAALNILHLLGPAISFLDSLAMTFGQLRISALTVIKSIFALAVLLWVATMISAALESRIRTSNSLTPSVQVLFSKLLKITLITIAVLAAIGTTGIDLTALAVFGGALGVGIGLGLQKVIANLFAGVILLLDKSIKPGDVVAVAGTYGWVNTLGGRYVSVVTRDGIEHLIPNEEFITTRVENWTHSDTNVRLKLPIGVHYDSDVEKAMELCIEAAKDTPRVLDAPHPQCLMRGFGDSSVNLELRFWIRDANEGVNNVRSELLKRVWRSFHDHGIEIPYPQRDLHLRSATPMKVTVSREEGDAV
jgi:small-conductance mechanosensitive channel